MATINFATASLDHRRGALTTLGQMSSDLVAVSSDVDQARLDGLLSRTDHLELRRRMKLAQEHIDKASEILFAGMEPTDPPGMDCSSDADTGKGANTEEHPVIEAA